MMKAADIALSLLRKSVDPVADIKRSSCYWQPLQWLYLRFAEHNELIRLSELDKRQQARYWSEVKNLEEKQWKKISICQAIYLWDKLKDLDG